MFDLKSPASLFALAALAVPFLIHLLNKREGKRIKVGSIRFLRDAQSNRLKSLKLTEVPLLILRALILSLLVLILAKPYWLSSSGSKSTEVGWVLLGPDFVNHSVDSTGVGKIDSLLASGYELRLFAPGFPKISREETIQRDSNDYNYWSLLREADQVAPANVPLWIFTVKRLANFRGVRPTIQRQVNWFTASIGGQNQWIERAQKISADSLRVEIGISDSLSTRFQTFTFHKPNEKTLLSANEVNLEVAPGGNEQMIFQLLGDFLSFDNKLVLQPQETLERFVIYHDESRQEDAAYINAALEAIVAAGGLKASITIRRLDESAKLQENDDWIFWLSDTPVAEHLLKKAGVIFRDARSSDYQENDSDILLTHETTVVPPRLFRRVEPFNRGVMFWQDSFGRPLLEIQKKDNSIFINYHSRFHPFWTDLVLSPVFPEGIEVLIRFVKSSAATLTSEIAVSDQRQIDDDQMLPLTTGFESSRRAEAADLRIFFWLAAFLLFSLERLLSERSRSVEN